MLQVLGLEQHSLAHLLHRYCNIRVDKSYQRADWRVRWGSLLRRTGRLRTPPSAGLLLDVHKCWPVSCGHGALTTHACCRPLPQPMLDYARQDAHYLVYLAHRLQRELQSGQDQLQTAWLRSQKMALHLYAKPTREVSVPLPASQGPDACCLSLQHCHSGRGAGAPRHDTPCSSSVACLQAAVASATSNVLRKLGQSHERLNGTSRQHVGGASRDCVIALCQWRDEVAREEDEGEHVSQGDLLVTTGKCPQAFMTLHSA